MAAKKDGAGVALTAVRGTDVLEAVKTPEGSWVLYEASAALLAATSCARTRSQRSKSVQYPPALARQPVL
jgi:hypothetical protein